MSSDVRPKGKLVLDPEIQAMATIAEVLDSLERDSHWRVLAWLGDRYRPESIDDAYEIRAPLNPLEVVSARKE